MKPLILFILLFSPLWALGQYPYTDVAAAIGVSDTISGHPWPNDPFLGGGVSTADFNRDGLDDLTIGTGINRPILFYLNNGDGTFTKLDSLIDNTSDVRMVLWADIDNDSDKDLFVSAYEAPDRLYENLGDLQLVEITEEAGLVLENARSFGAAFGDYNRDGFLDLYVGIREPDTYRNYFYRNNGDNTFTEVGISTNTHDNIQLTHQIIFADYNNDGEQDIYIANDRMYGNTMLINKGDETFEDISEISGAGLVSDAMNVGTGDFNHDGYMDIMVTNNAGTGGNVFLRNNGDLTFSDITDEVDVNDNLFCWAANFLDFDNDKDLDLYVCSQIPFPWAPNLLYMNMYYPTGVEDYNKPYPLGFPNDYSPSFSNAFFDFNQDGKLDIVVPNNQSFPIQIWANVLNNFNNYITFSLEGLISNLDGIGTTVEVYMGDDYLKRYMFCGDAYLSQNFDKLHFGLGTDTMIDSVVVTWLSGIQDRYYNVAANQHVHLVENASNTIPIYIETTPPSCPGGSDASAVASVKYGTPPFTFTWSNDSTSQILTGLTAGDYLLTVTDPFGQRGVSIATISEPEPLQLDLSTTHAVDGGDGAIDLVIGGGTPPYSVNWSNGDTQASISNLAGGVYYATVTDAHGCISSSYVAVYDETNCMAAVPLFVETSVNSAFLEWDSVPASLDYQLRYRKQGVIDWIETDSFPQPQTYLLDLDTATVYEYQTRTFCQSGSSSWSATQTFITKEQGAGACDSWEPLTIVTNAVIAVIQWDPQPDASLYRIRYRLEGTSDPWIEEESILPLITVSNLQNEKFYEFQTATLCGYGWSDWSDETYIFEVTPEFGGGVQEESPLEQKIQTSLTEVVEDIALTLSPNPASSFVQIQKPTREKGWLLLLDQAGRPVEQQLWSTNTLQLDLSPYPTGTYTVWFLSENGQLGITQLIKVR